MEVKMTKSNRNHYLDNFRGFTVISMVVFHLLYNINYYRPIGWYDGTLINKIWQLSIAISFFIISAVTSTILSREKNIKRGIKTSLLGFLISIVTYIFARDQLIVWGVLNGIGISMIIGGLLQGRVNFSINTSLIFIVLFALTYNMNKYGLYRFDFFKLLYDKNLFFLGFPSSSFYSTDYFPMIPWTFIFLAGLGIGSYLNSKNLLGPRGSDNPIAFIGRHAMVIYLAHQVVLYPLVSIFMA